MRLILAAVAVALLSPSCVDKEEETGHKPVPPPSTSSKIPWNKPQAGQGGGAFGALPQQPRR
ncbi:hypothetical protein [Luteolibacter soli]|uniref:Lipoprotein n=1 Tax=Luteolibacter soli TaxID=3135280 RepID=A0ABU9AZF9_9BACT